jgi:tRNA modification GTPase
LSEKEESGRAILLTPPGSAAIAVIRITGEGVATFLAAHFSGKMIAARCVHGSLRDGDRILDDPVVVLSEDGKCADINLHGGPWVVQSVLNLARQGGFEIAEQHGIPLPLDAIDGDSDLERLILQHLPLAITNMALTELLRQEEAWKQFENLDANARHREAAAMVDDHGLWWLLHPPKVAIIGVPNAGKSTLANLLYGQERSITADLPGTTRDWIGETANIGGLPVVLLDTPGIRSTSDAIEAGAIANAGVQIESADLVMVVLDASQPVEPQRELMERYPRSIRVMNKCDLAPGWEEDGEGVCHTVARDGTGIDAVRQAILEKFGVMRRSRRSAGEGPARWWTRQQQAALRLMMD